MQIKSPLKYIFCGPNRSRDVIVKIPKVFEQWRYVAEYRGEFFLKVLRTTIRSHNAVTCPLRHSQTTILDSLLQQDILSQIFAVIQSDVALQMQVHYNAAFHGSLQT